MRAEGMEVRHSPLLKQGVRVGRGEKAVNLRTPRLANPVRQPGGRARDPTCVMGGLAPDRKTVGFFPGDAGGR